MNIAVIGTGYVGLVTAAIFAHFKNKIRALDIDQKKINSLRKGHLPFYEPGLDKLIRKGLRSKKLEFTTSYQEALKGAEIIFICVGTPAKENGDYDLSFVYSAARSIGNNLKKYAVVAIKSTVPPNTCAEVKKIIEKQTNQSFDIASCPEFLREGSAVKDALHPSRIVIGSESKRAKELLLKIHQPIKGERLVTDTKSAQIIKYAANAFLATKISFINSIARICDSINADIEEVADGLGMDPRIGKQFLKAGLGYGGSCFPKDTWALIAYARRLGYDFKFLSQVDQVNKDQIDYFVQKIITACGGSVKGKILTVLGLSFKPQTDDMREARSIVLIQKLEKLGAKIKAYDPKATNNAKKILKKVKYCPDAYEALKESSALILVTEWPEFKELDFEKIKTLMKERVVIDGRNFLDRGKIKKLGFVYKGIGRN